MEKLLLMSLLLLFPAALIGQRALYLLLVRYG